MNCCKMKLSTTVLTSTRKDKEPAALFTPKEIRCKLPPLVHNHNNGCGDGMPPPARKITPSELSTLFRYGSKEKEVTAEVHQAEALVAKIADDLKIIKESVEKAAKAQKLTQIEIDKCTNREERNCLLKLKCKQQNELMECLKLEEKYFKDLQRAQRSMHESRVKKNSLRQEIFEQKVDQIYQSYEQEKEQMYQNRNYRERLHSATVLTYKHKSMKNLLESALNKKLDSQEKVSCKKIPSRTAGNRKGKTHVRVSNYRYRKLKDDSRINLSLKQYNQRQALDRLKTHISQQRLLLNEQAQLQKQKQAQKQQQRLFQRQELIDQGENPYVVDELLKVQDKLQVNEDKAIQFKRITMQNMEREIRAREQAYRKAKSQRTRWDKFWEAKAREKRRQNYYQNVVPYLSHDMKSSRKEKWMEVAKNVYGFVPSGENYYGEGDQGMEDTENEDWEQTDDEEEEALLRPTVTIKEESMAMKDKPGSSKKKPRKKGKRKASSKKSEKSVEILSAKSSSKNIAGELLNEEENEDEPELHTLLSPRESRKEECVGPFPILDLTALLPPLKSDAKPLEKPVFSWTPKIISFKDYEPGKVYKVKVVMTNKSRQRLKYYYKGITTLELPAATESENLISADRAINSVPADAELPPTVSTTKGKSKKMDDIPPVSHERSLKVLKPPLPAEPVASTNIPWALEDLLQVTFTVPKPISPGLQHTFLVSFHPRTQGDWLGHLNFTSELGTFELPVQISRKRFDPVINPKSILFENTVVDTLNLKRIKIKNEGGLPGWISQVTQPGQPSSSVSTNNDPVPDTPVVETLIKVSWSVGAVIEQIPPPTPERPETVPKSTKSTTRSKKKKKGGEANPPSTSPGEPAKGSTDSLKKGKALAKKKSSAPLDLHVEEKSRSEPGGTVASILDSIIGSVTEDVLSFYVENRSRKLEPGKELTVCVLFRPPYISSYASTFELSFEQESETGKICSFDKKLILDVTGTTIENPIYIQPLNGDYKICMIDQIYQLTVQAHSTRGSGKIKAQIPHCLKGLVDVYPPEQTTLTPTSPVTFAIKFSPRKWMLKTPERIFEYFDPETRILDFPVYFHLKCPIKVPSPIKATFMAIVSDTRLVVVPADIDLGTCSIPETVKAEVTVYNPTLVIQTIGFVDIPEEIIVLPNYGFGPIFPDETVTWTILFSPDSKLCEGAHTFSLKLQTLAREEYIINVKCVVKHDMSLALSSNRIAFPSTCCGSSSSTIVTLRSLHSLQKSILKFQTALDSSTPVRVYPDCGYMESGQEMKFSVTFDANVNDEEVQQNYKGLAQKQYNEQRNAYQRELASINMHLENDWMLEQDTRPEILDARTSQLLILPQVSNENLTKALERISSKKNDVSKSNQESQTVEQEVLPQKAPSSAIPLSRPATATSVASKKKTKKSPKKSPKKKTKEGDEAVPPSENRKAEETEKTQGKSNKKRKKVKPKGQDILETKVSITATGKDKIRKELEVRKKYILDKLEQSFDPSSVKDISTDSIEFSRAKRNLIRNLQPFSRTYRIPIFVYDDANSSQSMLTLTVKCPVQKPDLLLLDDSSTFDFGSVPTGEQAVREVNLYNVGLTPLTLHTDVLDPYGPFVQVNGLRILAPEHVFTLKIKFEPTIEDEFEQTITIYGGDSSISVTLRGTGIIREEEFEKDDSKREASSSTTNLAENVNIVKSSNSIPAIPSTPANTATSAPKSAKKTKKPKKKDRRE